MRIGKVATVCLVMIALSSCERVVDLQLPSASPRLVVEARLERALDFTSRTQTIRLSTTGDYFSGDTPPPARGATVSVTDNLGRVTLFTETANAGTYQAPASFRVARGRRYSLSVDYGGQHYTATDSTNEVPRINALYFERPQAGRYSGLNGVRAAIDYSDPPTVRNFYLWEQYVDGVRQLGPDSTVKLRIIQTDDFLDGVDVEGFQPFEGVDIKPGVVVLVRQIAISQSTYRYYYALNDQLNSDGSPFAVPPATVRGNVQNTTDVNHAALGYFSVSEVSERSATRP